MDLFYASFVLGHVGFSPTGYYEFCSAHSFQPPFMVAFLHLTFRVYLKFPEGKFWWSADRYFSINITAITNAATIARDKISGKLFSHHFADFKASISSLILVITDGSAGLGK